VQPDLDLAARSRAAAALRRLGHAIVGHHVDPALLGTVASHVEAWLPELEQAPARSRPVDDMKRRLYDPPEPEDPNTLDHFPDCVVSGPANPMGIAVRLHREGDDAVARVSLGAAFEGAPGRAHGGIVAAVFDDTMGLVLKVIATPAYTGELTVRYLAPTPVGEELEFRARLARREGRKLFMEAEATALGTGRRIATARAVFIAIEWRRPDDPITDEMTR
jgi:acyl-coenzyme A thioesterase PaaI-like protein